MHDLAGPFNWAIELMSLTAHQVNDFTKEWWGLFLALYITSKALIIPMTALDRRVKRSFLDRQEQRMLSSQMSWPDTHNTNAINHPSSLGHPCRPWSREDML